MNKLQLKQQDLVNMPLLHKGSVKDIFGKRDEAPYIFRYSNRFSVFDWGPLPDELTGKGEALAYMANLFFELLQSPAWWQAWAKNAPEFQALPLRAELKKALEQTLNELKTKGMSHHGLGLVEKAAYAVTPVQILNPKRVQNAWDYTSYQSKPTHALVPLEIIFRFGVPEGSSLLKRVQDQAYCQSLGLTSVPQVGSRFEHPVIEFSTKLEEVDRYLSYDEAQKIAGLTSEEFLRLQSLNILAAYGLKSVFAGVGVELWDGKFEFAFGAQAATGREFMLVDSIGPDELRLTFEGKQLSKENIRRFYRQHAWYHATEEAKQVAKARGLEDWKKICLEELKQAPPPLDPEIKTQVTMLYQSLAQVLGKHYRQEQPFPASWSLAELAQKL